MKFSNFLKKLDRDTSGATAVEYGLILALIFLVVVSSVQGVATATVDMWTDVERSMRGEAK